MGLIKPKKKPTLKAGDYHIIVNDENEKAKVFDHKGKQLNFGPDKLKTLPVLAKGVNGRTTWVNGGDTPPGLYKFGELILTQPDEPQHIWDSYGAITYDMEEQEGQENIRGRSGICAHGGWPVEQGLQPLRKTKGCLRFHNEHLEKFILPLTHTWVQGKGWVKKDNTVWCSVFQDYD